MLEQAPAASMWGYSGQGKKKKSIVFRDQIHGADANDLKQKWNHTDVM